MLWIGDIPLMEESQQLAKGNADLSQKWRTRCEFPGHGALTQANTVLAMLVHASLLDLWQTIFRKNNLKLPILQIKMQSTL